MSEGKKNPQMPRKTEKTNSPAAILKKQRTGGASITTRDWDAAAGVICPQCGQETLRIINGKCPQCFRNVTAESEYDMERRATKNFYIDALRKGRITLTQMKHGDTQLR